MHICIQKAHTHVEDPVVPVSLVDYVNTKITQHALKMSVFKMLVQQCSEEEAKRIIIH